MPARVLAVRFRTERVRGAEKLLGLGLREPESEREGDMGSVRSGCERFGEVGLESGGEVVNIRCGLGRRMGGDSDMVGEKCGKDGIVERCGDGGLVMLDERVGSGGKLEFGENRSPRSRATG